jgi:excisionase family DNA binding protein
MSTPTTERLLTISEVADYLNVSTSTVRYWRKIGTEPKVTLINGRLRWRMADVEAWIEKQQEDEP